MKRHMLGLIIFHALSANAADFPAASAEYRNARIEEYVPGCLKAFEDDPEIRVQYSHKTMEVFCTCRQRFKADVLAWAIEKNIRDTHYPVGIVGVLKLRLYCERSVIALTLSIGGSYASIQDPNLHYPAANRSRCERASR
jgi:hypothetical protein